MENITITVPQGTVNHGDQRLLCTPTRWTDIAVFFVGNYISHVATVRQDPGRPAVFILLQALLFPATSVRRGLQAIYMRAIFGTPLESALKAGALCIVVEKMVPLSSGSRRSRLAHDIGLRDLHDGPPLSEQNISPLELERRTVDQFFGPALRFSPAVHTLAISGRKVHGICCLPDNYELAILPLESVVVSIDEMDMSQRQNLPQRLATTVLRRPEKPPSNALASSYSFVKALVAILQTIFASVTLYRTQGDQVNRYGYAAFGFTVAPYLVMSVVNLVSATLTPDYPMVYLVKSELMSEALGKGGAWFEGMVGSFDAASSESNYRKRYSRWKTRRSYGLQIRWVLVLVGVIVISCIPIMIIGLMSHFRPGQSTTAQRIWTMGWLAFGIAAMGMAEDIRSLEFPSLEPSSKWGAVGAVAGKAIGIAITLSYTVPAIGGFVVVAQMMNSYGRCIRIF